MAAYLVKKLPSIPLLELDDTIGLEEFSRAHQISRRHDLILKPTDIDGYSKNPSGREFFREACEAEGICAGEYNGYRNCKGQIPDSKFKGVVSLQIAARVRGRMYFLWTWLDAKEWSYRTLKHLQVIGSPKPLFFNMHALGLNILWYTSWGYGKTSW